MDTYDLDNIVLLYDEDGNEIEFEIVSEVQYKGVKYCIVWSEDADAMAVVSKTSGEYSVVNDPDVIEHARSSFSNEMASIMGDTDEWITSVKNSFNGTKAGGQNEPQVSHMHSAEITFDQSLYVQKSEESQFVGACAAYNDCAYSDAMEKFNQEIDNGNFYAYARLGVMYYFGEACEQDYFRAYQLFSRGAADSCPLATAWLAECHRLGYGVDKDATKAQKIYSTVEHALDEMCFAGDDAAQYFYGYNLLWGIGFEKNESKGVRYLRQSTEKGNSRAAVVLAECYMKGWGVDKDFDTAFSLLLKHAKENNRRGQYLLGLCYEEGAGVERNAEKAFEHYLISANLGYGLAKSTVAYCYYAGDGVEQDDVQAAYWYDRAMRENKDGGSAEILGEMYLAGEGVAQDIQAAYECFRIAAELGQVKSQIKVANAYVEGKIWGVNYREAEKWLERAAKTGDIDAQMCLAKYYQIDDIDMMDECFDLEKSFYWYKEAAKQGCVEAMLMVGKMCLENGMDDEDEFGNEWIEKAAALGDLSAIFELGVRHMAGCGYKEDSEEGMRLYLKAAEGGLQEAYRELTLKYYRGIENYKGQVLYKDYNEARRFGMLAVQDESDHVAQYHYATVLLNAFGDYAGAEQWYSRAAKSGFRAPKIKLARMYIDQKKHLEEAFSTLHSIANEKYAYESDKGEAQFWLAVCYENGYGCKKDKQTAQKYYDMAKQNKYEGTKPKKKLFGLFG